jgi:DNA primase
MSFASDSKEIAEEFDLEYWFDRESRPFKVTHGSSGEQINAQECPVCGNMKWKVYLNKESGAGNCFAGSCGEKFSKLGFVHQALGHTMDDTAGWRETYKHVKECMSEQGWRPRRTVTVAVEYQEAVLPESFELPTPAGENLVYLEKRGFTSEIARYFHLRYCIHGKHDFTRPDGTKGYQKFDGRVIIPVFDLDGKFVTFQGRDTTGLAGDKKYLFASGLPGTGRYLLNGQSVGRARRVCMAEGIFDVAAMKMAFDEESELRDVVPLGSFGKHLSYGDLHGNDQVGQFRQLKAAGLEEVTIMWDGEWKALIAALDAAELLRQVGLRVRIAILPAGRDPNEVLPEVVRKAFWEATVYTKMLNVKWRLRDPFLGR